MFFTENMYEYESSIKRRMDNIENYHAIRGPRFVIETTDNRYNSYTSNEFSIYGRNMEKALRNATDLYKEYETEIDRMKKRVKQLASNPKNLKFEMEANNTINSLLSGKSSVIKLIMDGYTKVKKSQEDDIKLQKLLTGGVSDIGIGNMISDNDTYLEKVLSSGSQALINQNTFTPGIVSENENVQVSTTTIDQRPAPIENNKEVFISQPKKESL